MTRFTRRLNLGEMTNPRFWNLKKPGIFCIFLALSLTLLRAAEGSAPVTATSMPAPETFGSNEALRAYLQLQEQLHDMQLAMERNRLEAQSAAIQNSVTLSNRLQMVEQSLLVQRAQELESSQHANRVILAVVGVFAAVGFTAALVTAFFQWRAMSRFADISAALSAGQGLGFPSVAALGNGGQALLAGGAVEQSNARLINLIQHLEKRIAGLEQTTALPLSDSMPSGVAEPSHPELPLDSIADEKTVRISKLWEKGQALLKEQPEQAITVFDEILSLEPNHAEALVKKGTALEKLRQPQEALECYDRAIAVDSTLTIAFLHKGGLCSRLEKYGEAMECYERALHTQEKKRAA